MPDYCSDINTVVIVVISLCRTSDIGTIKYVTFRHRCLERELRKYYGIFINIANQKIVTVGF